MTRLVRHAMTTDPKTARPDMTPRDAAGLMASFDIGAVPIVADDGSLMGLVTDRDLVVRVLAGPHREPAAVRLGDVATRKSVVTVSPDATLADARDLLRQARVKRLPVVKGSTLVGMISLGDLALASASPREVGETVEDIFRSPSTESVHERSQPATGTPDRVRAGHPDGGNA